MEFFWGLMSEKDDISETGQAIAPKNPTSQVFFFLAGDLVF